ncbi:hypothetical protein HDG34_001593 [Paraburkholderia sp. HC6.4b]|uniref:hypothetical protein n=1 Tax=unclassified Paraburkholderia TaxID=2615204 RepID=UPI00161462A2|nr:MULTISPECIES: hypothetical protein [unclassified Paraburkholderia]MBB5407661.1 hypothetical protein [Paraburkholderia sp. HC6.4b]MBB5452326.1 hypothetical protein [Paraburkholderia sp. Kb1A]
MKILSPHIDHAVQIAVAAGNSVKEVSEGWSKVRQVVHMTSRMSEAVRNDIQSQIPSLRYWSSDRTPHNPAEDGFICEEYQVGLSFPRA